MAFLQKLLKNGTNLISLVGVILVFGIVLSGVDAMYILLVLGAMNCLYGLYAIITKKPILKSMSQEKQNSPRYNLGMGVCQLCMGVFVLIMGLIYVKNIVTGKYFWDVMLAGMIVIMIFWYIIKIKSRKY